MGTAQIAIRLPEALLSELDGLVASGAYANRAAAARAGIEAVVRLEHRRQVDRALADGYRRIPPTAAEHEGAVASLREAILEEPW